MTWQLRTGALLGAASVGLGAYGAHGLKGKKPEYHKVWSTAVQYQQLGAVSLMAISNAPKRARLVGGLGIVLGTALFSGTNYVVAYTEDRQYAKGAPIGGMLMMAGLAAIAIL